MFKGIYEGVLGRNCCERIVERFLKVSLEVSYVISGMYSKRISEGIPTGFSKGNRGDFCFFLFVNLKPWSGGLNGKIYEAFLKGILDEISGRISRGINNQNFGGVVRDSRQNF